MTKTQQFRVPDDLADRINQAATAEGLTPSSWLRRLVTISLSATNPAPSPKRTYKPPPPPNDPEFQEFYGKVDYRDPQ